MRATMHFMPNELKRGFFSPDAKSIPAIAQHYYQAQFTAHDVDMPSWKASDEKRASEGEQFAEEMFDLTNNPSRQEERELLYGRGQSLSTGDIVEVEDRNDPEIVTDWLCLGIGWFKLEKAA